MTIAPFFYFDSKNFKEIQQIIISTKVANIVKKVVKAIINLAIIAKKKQFKNYCNRSKINKKYFNYRKIDFSTKNYYVLKKKPKKLLEKAKHT